MQARRIPARAMFRPISRVRSIPSKLMSRKRPLETAARMTLKSNVRRLAS